MLSTGGAMGLILPGAAGQTMNMCDSKSIAIRVCQMIMIKCSPLLEHNFIIIVLRMYV